MARPRRLAAYLISIAQVTLHFRDTLERLIKRGLAHGAQRTGRISFDWSVAGRCQAPVVLELFARGNRMSRLHFGGASGDKESLRVALSVPCRQCVSCLAVRAARWRHRATEETRFASRTWFATLTFRPEVHTAAYYAALSRARARASDEDEFRLRASGLGSELTKYIKRVRKNSGAPIRYLLVTERHKSGLPHFHALFHERDYLKPLRYRDLAGAYDLGHAKFNLVEDDPKAVRYVCKYIGKDAAARVRASLSYGDPAGRRAAEVNQRPSAITRKSLIEADTGCEVNDSPNPNPLWWQRLLDREIDEIVSNLPSKKWGS